MEAELETRTDKEIDEPKNLDNVDNDIDKDDYVDEIPSNKAKEVVVVESPPPAESCMPCYPETSKAEMGSLLPPDHPLLQRFQQSLKEHLLRIKNQLADEISDIKHKIKLKEDERQEFGVKLYDMQHQIEKQNEVLEEYSINIHETVTKRIENEKLRDSLKNEYEAKLAITKQQKFNYNQRVVDLNHLQNLENNIRSWTNEFETELTSSKRVVKKDVQLQKAIAEEKQKSDLMSYNLQVEVQKREEELAGLTQQISEQKEQNNILQSGLSDANADLEVLQQEHKRLNQSWGEVIVAIQHRDKVLFQAKETLNKQKEFLKLTYSSIEATKKQTVKETDQNAKLEAFKTRLTGDLLNLKKETDKQSKVLAKLEMKMEELPTILEQTEKDYQESKKEGHQLGVQLNILQSKLERQYSTKTKLEETILKIAQDQLLCDKASQYRFKVLNERQQQRRTMEVNMHKVQIQLNDMLMSLERQKTSILNLHEESERLSAILKNLSDEADGLSGEIKEIEKQISFKLKIIDKLSKELDELIKAAEGCEVSPTENKIKTLERTIHETDEEIRKLQQFWVNLQEHIIHLSKRRNSQVSEIQVTRKQLMIMSQKSLKIDNDVEKTESNSREITREIQKFATKLELLSAKVYEKRKQHETAEFDCELAHFELLQKLRDSEMKVLQLEQETVDLQCDIEHHKELVLEAHRESLSWETKYKLIDETLRWRSNEKATESEIGNMRAEIHRMQIRYKELKRAQEKLILDLDHCVMHRERIFVVASTKQKMDGAHFRSRTNIQQRINDLKSKMKQVNFEITAAEKKLNELSKEYVALEVAKSKVQRDVDDEIYQDKLIASEIEQGILLKHQNLDRIVRKQNRAKEYRRLTAASTQPRLSKSEATIEFHMQKQSEINQNLTEIVESLISEFPEKKFLLMRLLQTLKD